MKKTYTYGVFDLLHYGHIRQLRAAKKLGDFLIVGVFDDATAEEFKRRPIMSLADRMEMLEHIDVVDQVVVQDTFSPLKNIGHYEPDIVAKGEGAGWTRYGAPKEIIDSCVPRGIEVRMLDRTPDISTSDIIEKIYARNKQ